MHSLSAWSFSACILYVAYGAQHSVGLEVVFGHQLHAVVGDPMETFICQTIGGFDAFRQISVLHGRDLILAAKLELADGP